MNAVVKQDPQPQALQPSATPADLLRIAVAGGADLEKMEKLMELQERWEANEARKAFVAAMAAFKGEPMVIGKNKHVSFTTAKGKTEYDHAELCDITDVVVPNLSKHGLSHDWNVRQDQGRGVTVVCTITHVLGHSKSVEMTAPPDESGGKNTIQAIASTKTYLERYTLLAACGLATGGTDDDGRTAYAFDPGVLDEATLEELEEAADTKRKAAHDEAYGRLSESIAFIKERIEAGDLSAAASEWAQFSQSDQRALWVAPSKGGCLTTRERELVRQGVSANAPKENEND